MPLPIFSHDVTGKGKVISKKSIFFVNITTGINITIFFLIFETWITTYLSH